jgi:hypothetical protein
MIHYFSMFLKKLTLILFLFVVSMASYGQNDSIRYEAEIMGLASSGASAPFWLQSNSYGKILPSNCSGNALIGITKDFGSRLRPFDYGFKADGFVQYGNSSSSVYFHELYAKARLFVFDLTVGSREEYLGVHDTTLSSGGLIFSSNARPMPKITAEIERFSSIPFTDGYAEIRGAVSHGWFSKDAYEQGALLHHKWAQMRIGGELPVNFQYGFEHIAIWGGTIESVVQPSSIADLKTVFLAKGGGSDVAPGEQINAMGNHIISQNMRLDIEVAEITLSAYWQNISEDRPILVMWKTMNTPDGLWGITLKSKRFPLVKGVLYEYVNTSDQSGPYHDKDGIIYGGSDGYFTNYIYQSGWTYRKQIIGTPFISNVVFDQAGKISSISNRVQVHHFGVEGSVDAYNYKLLASFSKNYGKYPLSEELRKDNRSYLLEINKQFSKFKNIEFSASLGIDQGALYGNRIGILCGIRKRGNLLRTR